MSLATWPIATVTICTLALTSLALSRLLPVLERQRVIDVPNHRSSHVVPTPRGGGLGIVAGILAGSAVAVAVLQLSGDSVAHVGALCAIVAAMAGLGWLEDSRGLTVKARLSAQVAIFGASAALAVTLGQLALGVTAIAVLGGVFYVNAANFMDGVNGISSLHGTVVGTYFALIGFTSNLPVLVTSGMVVASAFLGFLPWNTPRARMFMGDVGSYVLGAASWVLATFAISAGINVLTAVAPLLIYTADVAFTLARRVARRAPLGTAHHEHVYQFVQQSTGSHAPATALVTMASVACAAAGFISHLDPSAIQLSILGVLLVGGAYLAIPALVIRFPQKARVES